MMEKLVYTALGAFVSGLIALLFFFLREDRASLKETIKEHKKILDHHIVILVEVKVHLELLLKKAEKITELEKDLNNIGQKVREHLNGRGERSGN